MPEVNHGALRGELLFLHALTSLHPGSGTALGVVDLPVQRERHTRWPNIPGSALKGVLRDYCRRAAAGSLQENDCSPDLTAAFGPPTAEADKHAGALSFTDARILAFPVRSLKGIFAWVSCPAVLDRFVRDAALAGRKPGFTTPKVDAGKALLSSRAVVGIGKNNSEAVFEEFAFAVADGAGDVAKAISELAIADEATRARLVDHFAILPDDDFNHFVQHATEVVARVALNYETKTVREGALFYQEFLPPETIFYSVVIATASRNGSARRADEMLSYLRKTLAVNGTLPVIQIGGDETTGKGLCALSMTRGQ